MIGLAPLLRLRARRRRRLGARPSILWGPTPIINIRYTSRADRMYGYRSDTLVYDVYAINATQDFDYVLNRFRAFPFVRHLVPYAALIWAVVRYDVFGLFFDGGLLGPTPSWRLELPLLRLAGKKIVVYPYGGDARIPSATRASGRWNAYTDVLVGAEDRDEADVREHLRAFGRHAHVVLGCNDLVADLPRLDGVFRYPVDVDEIESSDPPEEEVVTVVHASNHRHYKGTRFVVQAVEQLQREGLPVRLRLVEGLPRDQVIEACRQSSIVASDFLIGGYAMFAIEAMAVGRVVLAYLPERLFSFHPEWREAPVVNASPDTLADELRVLVNNPARRRELGARGPEYVRRYHSLSSVGKDLDAIYRGLWR